jgi:hypothetical protein
MIDSGATKQRYPFLFREDDQGVHLLRHPVIHVMFILHCYGK